MLSCFNSVGKLGSTIGNTAGGNLLCLVFDKVILHYGVSDLLAWQVSTVICYNVHNANYGSFVVCFDLI